jgi:hypothetical protein
MKTSDFELSYKTLSNEIVFIKNYFKEEDIENNYTNRTFETEDTIRLNYRNIVEIIKLPKLNPKLSNNWLNLNGNDINKIKIPKGFYTVLLEGNPLEKIWFEKPDQIIWINLWDTSLQNFDYLKDLKNARIVVSPFHKINSQLGLLKFKVFNL